MYFIIQNSRSLKEAFQKEKEKEKREKHRITRHNSAELQKPNNPSQPQNTQLNLLTVTFLAI